MSRPVRCRWVLSGELVAQSPVHIGNLGEDGSELTQARDGLDRPVIPGTGLAGAIRSALGEHEPGLWGRISGRNERGGDDGTGEASWVWVEDAIAPAETVPEVRDGVSIDRIGATAARGHLFTREVLPVGTRFRFRLAVDDRDDYDENHVSAAQELARRVARLLRGPAFAVGGGTSRGLGRMLLENPVLTRFDLGTRSGMLDRLRGQGVAVDLGEDAGALRPGMVRVSVPWTPLGPVMTLVAADGDVISAFPLVGSTSSEPRLVLPGSSLKGVWRSHAERIMRTVTGTGTPEKFLDQMKAEGLGPVGVLFGTAGDQRLATQTGMRGALTVHECASTVALPGKQWRDVRLLQRRLARTPDKPSGAPRPSADDQRDALAALQRAIDSLNAGGGEKGVRFVVAPHVAIDRWTGGAAEGLLFAVLEPHTSAGTWQDLVVEVDTRRLGDAADTALMLLLLVLRDLCDGWIAFGHGTTRGMGSVQVVADQVTFEAAGETGWPGVAGRTLAEVLQDTELLSRLAGPWAQFWAKEAIA